MEIDGGKPAAGDLQFDRAEFSDGAPQQLVCAGCKCPILKSYYAVGDQTVCEACKGSILAELSAGSGVGRFLRAVLFGVPAAAAGSAVYYAIAKLTGYEFGLVAVLIGLLVGGAVRYGSRRRGGWAYQTLAVGLTYLSIASTYVPFILEEIQKEAQQQQTDSAAVQPEAQEGAGAEQPGAQDPEAEGAAVEDAAEADEVEVEVEGEPVEVPAIVVAGVLLALAIAAPVLGGFENIMGLVIIGIGLYEAWRLNKRNDVQVTGPYELSPGAGPVTGR